MSQDFELFKGKTLSNVFEDIYYNQRNKKQKISEYIDDLMKFITHKNDAAVLAPIIKDLIDTSVKNDEQLVKLATIAQRIIAAENKTVGQDGFLTEAERKQLLSDLSETKKEVDNIDVDDVSDYVETAKSRLNVK
jgi:hypothetical protein